MKPPIKDLAPEALEAWLAERGERPYRLRQILQGLWARGAGSFAEMTDLPASLRESLDASFSLALPEIVRAPLSEDGTRKLLLSLADDRRVETVMIPADGETRNRMTLCVSSQVGCAMGCAFCATATLGFGRHLRASEIADQVLVARTHLPPDRKITNLVFMGMGEPLHNFDEVVRAIAILTSDWGLGISPRRITVSTVGLVPAMTRLLEETRAHLAVSLTATTDALRDRLMPVNRKYPLAELFAACRELPLPRRKRITFEYVMLDGENDRPEDADRLVRWLHGIRSKVNLIPFNAFPGTAFRPSPRDRIDAFRDALVARGVHATIRESRGRDVQAACGQLAAAG